VSETSDMSAFDRGVDYVRDPPFESGNVRAHKARMLLEFGHPAATDPFLGMAEDWTPHGAFEFHPHRGIETVTFVLEGTLEHHDNLGNKGTIRPGDAQWMTAGGGILHEENPPKGTLSHTLQLWVNLPAADKMVAPRYQDLVGANMRTRHLSGVNVRVFSGVSGDVAADTLNYVPVTLLDITLAPNAIFTQGLPAFDNAFIVVLEGTLLVGSPNTLVSAQKLVWLSRDDQARTSNVTVRAQSDSVRLLLVSGRPLHEPVVQRGPFVMNTEAEIERAFADFRAGRFGR
jgi:quercetin 2,3-dioxygenase